MGRESNGPGDKIFLALKKARLAGIVTERHITSKVTQEKVASHIIGDFITYTIDGRRHVSKGRLDGVKDDRSVSLRLTRGKF